MRLKKIVVIGFKSFADKTVLEFHKGVTGIVGPNGCGKSNISDAFRWVMGEQSAKSMRGNKMLDVIFAGTTSRKPLNYCEVTITLTDIEEELSLPYHEVSITRRLHRSGESEYFINNKTARLKDIQDILMDCGIGKNSFSMFEQGKLDQVINYSPLERRTIFEEASGIMRFLQRKKEALRKLEHTDSNLSRVQDIMQEVERQIIVLEQQAEKAKIYKEDKALFEALERALLLTKWDRLRMRGEKAAEKEKEQQSEIEQAEEALHALEAELKKVRDALLESEKQFQEQKEALYQALSTKEIQTKEKHSQQERLQEAIAKEQQWLQELGSMEERQKVRQQEALELEERQKQAEAHLEELEKVRSSQQGQLQELETEVNGLRKQQGELQRELLQLTHKEKKYESEWNQNQVRLEGNQERKQRLIERQEKASASLQESLSGLESKKQTAEAMSAKVREGKEIVEALQSQLTLLREEIKEKQQKLDAAAKQATEMRARQKVLLRLREDMEGFSKGSKRILQEAGKEGSSLYQKVKGLYEYIQPENGAEKELSTALRPYAQTLVVETEQDFRSVVEYAKANGLKDYSLLSLASLKEASDTDSGTLIDSASKNPVSTHFLHSILVSETLEEAWEQMRSHPGKEILVKEGLFIDSRGVAFYATSGENNAFMREAELKSLMKTLKQKEAEQETLENELNASRQKRTETEQEKETLEKSVRHEELQLVEAEFAVKRFQSDLEKMRTESEQQSRELQTLEESSRELSASIQQLQKSYAEAKEEAAEKQKMAESLEQELSEKASKLQSEQAGMRERASAYQAAAEECRKIAHQLNVLEVKNQESLDHQKRLRSEIESSREQQKQIREKFSQFDSLLTQVEEDLTIATEKKNQMEQQVAEKRKSIQATEEQLQESREEVKQQEEKLYKTKIETAQIESSREAMENEFLEHHGRPITDLDPEDHPLEETIEKSERQLRSLRQKLESSGDINMTSIEEFEKHKERYEFLSQQIDDLNQAKNELIEIITELDTESRKIFTETFEVIRANFRKNFEVLFRGGEADLEFTETDDILEAGIEIIARPPGKQMRSIQLMSGGEKCLTAVALMFAIFEVKAAPFCILDEIDAPLDDTNVQRFVNVVQQFVDRCQFIIITHNKGTMEIADRLFGVSMQEKGVSRLLAMELSEDTEREPVLV